MPAGPQFLTTRRILECTKMLAEGCPRAEVMSYLMDGEGLRWSRANRLFQAAMREAKRGWVKDELEACRARMVEIRLTEAKRLRDVGDTEGAALHLSSIDVLLAMGYAAAAKQQHST